MSHNTSFRCKLANKGLHLQLQCGGFLAEKWLGKPAPEPFSEGMTPSLRKVCQAPFIHSTPPRLVPDAPVVIFTKSLANAPYSISR